MRNAAEAAAEAAAAAVPPRSFLDDPDYLGLREELTAATETLGPRFAY